MSFKQNVENFNRIMNNVHLGHIIRQLIEQYDGGIQAGAERLGVTIQNLYAIFKKEDVNTALLKKISTAYNVPLTYFFNSYLWVDKKSSITDNGAVKLVAAAVQNDTRLMVLEVENKSQKEQISLLREMVDMYKRQENLGQIAGQNDDK